MSILRDEFSGKSWEPPWSDCTCTTHGHETRHVDSDINVLTVIDGRFDYDDLLERTSPIVARLSLEYDVVISRAFVPASRFKNGRSP